MRTQIAVAGLLLALAACSGRGDADARISTPEPDKPSPTQSAGTPTTSPTASRMPVEPLPDGPVSPGRYRYAVGDTCDPALGCPTTAKRPLPDVLVTVPAGWRAANEVHLIEADNGSGTGAPDGAGLVMGWTSYWAALNSRPCSSTEHHKPDVAVGPTVEDFVDAVAAHPRLDVTRPRPVRLGGYRGRFLTLTGPSDISGCVEWRPWEPSPYLQGPSNTWDLWVMDVAGVRVVVMAGYYPDTAAGTRSELRAMVESIRFVPRRA